MNTKTVVELPIEDYQQIRAQNAQILEALKKIKLISDDEYLPRKEFMAKVGIGHTKFAELAQCGKLKTKIIGRKTYVPRTEIARFFKGEVLINDK